MLHFASKETFSHSALHLDQSSEIFIKLKENVTLAMTVKRRALGGKRRTVTGERKRGKQIFRGIARPPLLKR